MKNKILKISLLAALLTGVAAAQSNEDSVRLQPVVVTSPRYLDAEKEIEASLSELRDSARAPATAKVDLPLLKRVVNSTPRVRLPDMAARSAEALTLRVAVKA